MLTETQECALCECRTYPNCKRFTNAWNGYTQARGILMHDFLECDFVLKDIKRRVETCKRERDIFAKLLTECIDENTFTALKKKERQQTTSINKYGEMRHRLCEKMLGLKAKIDNIDARMKTMDKYEPCDLCMAEHAFNDNLQGLRHRPHSSPY